MATEREGFLDFRGMKVWYHVAGPLPAAAERPPLLLLHGGPGGNSCGFEPFDALADDGRTVIRYDELGGGRSDRPHDPALWVPATFVELLARVRDELGLDRVHLFGWSWGGMLAMEYLRSRPTGIVSLSLVSAPASSPDYLEDAAQMRAELPRHIQAALARFEARWEPSPPEDDGVDPGMTVEQIEKGANGIETAVKVITKAWFQRLAAALTRVFPRSHTLYDIVAMAYVTEHVFRGPRLPRPMARMLAASGRQVYETLWGLSEFHATGPLAEWDAQPWLGEIDVPTLVTCGRYDTVQPHRAKAIAERIPGAELVVFEDSGHSAMYEEPERFFATVTDFLARADGPRRLG